MNGTKKPEGDGAHGRQRTVLVVEDNPLNLELVTDVMTAHGWRVLQASRAAEGIALARSHNPDVILMDVSLPGMDGLRATAALARDPCTRDIPVIGVSAHAMKGDEKAAFRAGCCGYITKPIDVRSFARQVEDMIMACKRPEAARACQPRSEDEVR
ncbi:MAG: response regulator [Kiritimatiellaeota bacterium]|nr:response regulator [Kiritimatiellota bacterium]